MLSPNARHHVAPGFFLLASLAHDNRSIAFHSTRLARICRGDDAIAAECGVILVNRVADRLPVENRLILLCRPTTYANERLGCGSTEGSAQ